MAARVTAFVVFAIVAVTFVAGLIVGAQREDDSGPVDLIVYNARVYTGVPHAQFAEAVAIRGNRILRVGSNREIKRLMRRATTVIDAHGGSVTAGFHDGNVDLKAAGLALERETQAAEAAAASAKAEAASAAAVAAATGATASAAATDSRGASRVTRGDAVAARTALTPLAVDRTLERLAVDEPGDTLEAIRRAIGEANRVGVTSVDVAARTPDDLLAYDTLLRTRELTARVTASLAAEWPLDDAAVARLDATRKRYEGIPFFKVAAVRLTVSDGVEEAPTRATAVAAGRGESGVGARVGAAATMPARTTTVGAGRRARAGAGSTTHGMTRGALALASAPVVDPVSELSRSIALLESRGWQVILQTKDAGDADLALNALEAVATTAVAEPKADQSAAGATGAADAKPRVRLELGAGVDAPTVKRMVRLGVIASVQNPATAAPDASEVAAGADVEGVADRAAAGVRSAASAGVNAAAAGVSASGVAATPARGVERAGAAAGDGAGPAATATARDASRGEAGEAAAGADADAAAGEHVVRQAWPYATLLAGAAPFVFHSGWPVAPLDPRFALSAVLVDGLTFEDAGADGKAAATKVDAEGLAARLARALDAYTRHAAYASANEDQQGTLAKTMLADLVIFNGDLFNLPPDKILDAEVSVTIFDGKVVYTRQPDAAPIPSSQ